jgi:hypothetical protein
MPVKELAERDAGGGFQVTLGANPKEPERVVLTIFGPGACTIDTIHVAPEDAMDAFHHPSLYSEVAAEALR